MFIIFPVSFESFEIKPNKNLDRIRALLHVKLKPKLILILNQSIPPLEQPGSEVISVNTVLYKRSCPKRMT